MALSVARQVAADAIKNTKDAVADGRITRWQDAADAICGALLVLIVSGDNKEADTFVPVGVARQIGGYDPTVVNAPYPTSHVLDTDTIIFKPR